MAKQTQAHATPAHAPEETQARMSFGEHLDELRRRILRALFGSAFAVGGCIVYYREIVRFVSRPYSLVARAHHLPDVFSTLKPQEGFLTSITLAVQAGLVIASPWIIYQLWQFVASGLFAKERKIVYRYTAPSALLFLLGVAFFYCLVLPVTLNFFMKFAADTSSSAPTPNWLERFILQLPAENASTQSAATGPFATRPAILPMLPDDPAPPPVGQALIYMDARDGQIKIRTPDSIYTINASEQGALFYTTWRYDDYLSFVMFSALIFGLAFEMPMVIMILARIGIVQVATFRRVRKYAYFGIVALAVLAAPSGDPMTLALLAIPLVILYEVGILAASVVTRNREQFNAE